MTILYWPQSLQTRQSFLSIWEKQKDLVHPRNRVIGFVLLPIRPAELGKTTNTPFTTCNNLHASRVAILLQGKQQNTTLSISHAQNRARSSFAMARKGAMKWNASPGQNVRKCPRRSVVHSCFPCSNLWSERASKRQCPREALFKVVKVVQVVFHVSTSNHSIFEKNQKIPSSPCLRFCRLCRGTLPRVAYVRLRR